MTESKAHIVTCPNCGEQMPIDDKAYNKIVNEVCNEEINRRISNIKAEMDRALSEKAIAIRAQAESEYQIELEKKRTHFVKLKEETNAEIAKLQSKIELSEKDKYSLSSSR